MLQSTPESVYLKMLTDVGPLDGPQNLGPLPVHLGPNGLDKSIHMEVGLFLKNFCDRLGALRILELGTFRGYSTAWLMLSAWGRAPKLSETETVLFPHVYTHDIVTFGSYGEYAWKRFGIPDELVTYVKAPIWEAPKPNTFKFDFVFHDSSHEIGDSVKEMDWLLPNVRVGGVMVIDDTSDIRFEASNFYFRQLFFKHKRDWEYKEIALGHGLGVARRIQ